MREATSGGSMLYYFAADHLGSTSVTMDANGTKIGEMRYMPFGETRYLWGGTPTDRRFTGQREENGLGSLYDFGARFYSPAIGRFISADTIIATFNNPQALNRYSYVYNNPVNGIDPTGHMVINDGGGGMPTPPQPKKGNTSNNGSGTPANQARSADDTGGNDQGVGSPETLPRPDIFTGSPQDVAEAWNLLETAAAYGPLTRGDIEVRLRALQILQGYGQTMKTHLVEDKWFSVGNFDTNAIDLGDIRQLPDNLQNPLNPAVAFLHEFTEQYDIHIGGLEFSVPDHYAIDADYVANTERFSAYPAGAAPIRPYADDVAGYDANGQRNSMTILYNTTYPQVGGDTQARVTLYTGSQFSVVVEWRRP